MCSNAPGLGPLKPPKCLTLASTSPRPAVTLEDFPDRRPVPANQRSEAHRTPIRALPSRQHPLLDLLAQPPRTRLGHRPARHAPPAAGPLLGTGLIPTPPRRRDRRRRAPHPPSDRSRGLAGETARHHLTLHARSEPASHRPSCPALLQSLQSSLTASVRRRPDVLLNRPPGPQAGHLAQEPGRRAGSSAGPPRRGRCPRRYGAVPSARRGVTMALLTSRPRRRVRALPWASDARAWPLLRAPGRPRMGARWVVPDPPGLRLVLFLLAGGLAGSPCSAVSGSRTRA
jgi:hypothetical protein